MITGTSKGFGYVIFSNFNESKRAMEELDGQRLLTKAVEISHASWKGKEGVNQVSSGSTFNQFADMC